MLNNRFFFYFSGKYSIGLFKFKLEFYTKLCINRSFPRIWSNIFFEKKKVSNYFCLKINKTLTEFDISWSDLNYDGSVALRRVLIVNKVLERLNISSCNIDWSSAKLISEGLAKNSTLNILNVRLCFYSNRKIKIF